MLYTPYSECSIPTHLIRARFYALHPPTPSSISCTQLGIEHKIELGIEHEIELE